MGRGLKNFLINPGGPPILGDLEEISFFAWQAAYIQFETILFFPKFQLGHSAPDSLTPPSKNSSPKTSSPLA
jgi:hypothetical protein